MQFIEMHFKAFQQIVKVINNKKILLSERQDFDYKQTNSVKTMNKKFKILLTKEFHKFIK